MNGKDILLVIGDTVALVALLWLIKELIKEIVSCKIIKTLHR